MYGRNVAVVASEVSSNLIQLRYNLEQLNESEPTWQIPNVCASERVSVNNIYQVFKQPASCLVRASPLTHVRYKYILQKSPWNKGGCMGSKLLA